VQAQDVAPPSIPHEHHDELGLRSVVLQRLRHDRAVRAENGNWMSFAVVGAMSAQLTRRSTDPRALMNPGPYHSIGTSAV
jgi:hypothetical protein